MGIELYNIWLGNYTIPQPYIFIEGLGNKSNKSYKSESQS
jgi:hypothetical protein